jgi:hypothetical protein
MGLLLGEGAGGSKLIIANLKLLIEEIAGQVDMQRHCRFAGGLLIAEVRWLIEERSLGGRRLLNC